MESYKIGGVTALLGRGGGAADSDLAVIFKGSAEANGKKKIVFQEAGNKKKKKKRAAEENDKDGLPSEKTRRVEDIPGLDSDNDDQITRRSRKKVKINDIRQNRTVFVGNVSLSTSRKELNKHFAKYGEIETVRIRSLPVANPKLPRRACAAKKMFHKERDSMNSYIVFADEDSAVKALESNGDVLGGHYLRVDMASASKEHDHSKSIFVGNLPFITQEDELRNHFEDCGDIADVRIIRDKVTGVGKGFGYVRFESRDGVTFALKKNETELKGRTLRISRSVDPKKKKERSQIPGTKKKLIRRISEGKKKERWRDSEGKKKERWRDSEGKKKARWRDSEGKKKERWRDSEGKKKERWRDSEGNRWRDSEQKTSTKKFQSTKTKKAAQERNPKEKGAGNKGRQTPKTGGGKQMKKGFPKPQMSKR